MLSVSLAGAKLQNPTVLASGVLGTTGASLIRVAKEGAGAVTTKSISLEARKGHPTPVITTFDAGMINAVGLSNPGIKDFLPELEAAVKGSPSPVIASIFASTIEEFGELAKEVSQAKPSLIELNISCPNVNDEFGRPFACDAVSSSEVVKAAKKGTAIPLFVKLSPNVANIGAIAQAVEKAGADGITAINTVGPGMQINIEAAMPVLTNKVGGVSGPAIKPVAVRCVYDIYKATKLPIIGTGGVTNARDAIEMVMAGATAVGIGSAVYYGGVEVFSEIPKGMREFMESEGYSKIEKMRGIAHEE
ncbi:dihydroorotate dehydrogenase [Candidatus Micrarchaeota archaeon]|nr:dihydroorotate dehydrogenase [Candidatus Micrarchaeota archaeon]